MHARLLMALCAAAACTASLAWGAPHNALQSRISAVKTHYPEVRRGHVGFEVIDLTTGAVLAQQDAEQFFVPASNTKLYTTALALVRLGPGYKFQTELRTSGAWHPGQTSLPDLQIIGGGDPNLSGRILPYKVDAKPGDPLVIFRELAKKLADSGIQSVEGDVTGVATRYPGDLYPPGWTIEDAIYGYGAPVSSLTFNDNAVSVTLTAAEPGEPAQLSTVGAAGSLIFLNEVLSDSSAQSHVHVERRVGSNEVVLSGSVGKAGQPWQEDLAVIDPAGSAAIALIDALRQQGITVRGEARSQYSSIDDVGEKAHAPVGTLLATHQSIPLSDEIAVVNKESQNLHAEMLLREAGFVAQGSGTLQAGVDERTKFLQELGITPESTGFALYDGSGLARQDLTTVESTVTLLRAMWNRPERAVWLASLPVGGVDGTLEHRFKGITGAERVHAKTGSLSHVSSLSGYIQKKQGGWLAFSMMVNSTVGHEAEVRDYIDHVCAVLLGIK